MMFCSSLANCSARMRRSAVAPRPAAPSQSVCRETKTHPHPETRMPPRSPSQPTKGNLLILGPIGRIPLGIKLGRLGVDLWILMNLVQVIGDQGPVRYDLVHFLAPTPIRPTRGEAHIPPHQVPSQRRPLQMQPNRILEAQIEQGERRLPCVKGEVIELSMQREGGM